MPSLNGWLIAMSSYTIETGIACIAKIIVITRAVKTVLYGVFQEFELKVNQPPRKPSVVRSTSYLDLFRQNYLNCFALRIRSTSNFKFSPDFDVAPMKT